MLRALVIGIGLAAALGVLSGCQTSYWRQFYQANAVPPSFGPRETVQIRVVTPEQLQDANARIERYLNDRKIAPEDADAEVVRAVREIEMDAFRIDQDPAGVAKLGFSAFYSVTPASRDDPSLIAHSKRIGADFVVISTAYRGQQAGYTLAPTFSTSTANAWANAYGSHGWSQGNATGVQTTTAYVPVPTTYHLWDSFAYYYRYVTPEERAMLDATYPNRSAGGPPEP